MSTTKRFLKKALYPIVRLQALHRIDSISAIDIPVARSIALAIRETLTGDVSTDERDWVDRIEALRSSLAHSTAPVPFVDFGAGTQQDARSAEEMSTGVRKSITVADASRASKAPFWCLLLFKLVRKLQPTSVIELGTCVGISAAYQAAAQQLNSKGRLITLEGSPALASLSQNHMRSLGLNNASVVPGRFLDTLDTTINSLDSVQYAFIDGHHDELATLTYFKQLSARMPDHSIAIFDDISWSPGMRRAWHALEEDPNVSLSVDLRTIGICVVDHRFDKTKHRLRLTLPA